jgi:16S rRNA (cytidine1402-2'-O)-methyltransferase
MPGLLSVVATPIGNLEDITLRALRVLREADIIAAEDTRRTAKLLTHHGIRTRTISFHTHNAGARLPQLLRRLAAGQRVALVSDAGTPGISDPGVELVSACRGAAIGVEAIPGASAPLTAIVLSGFPTNPLTILGFPPHRSKDRDSWLVEASRIPNTFTFFESPHRILATLVACGNKLVNRQICVARELTKAHESTYVDWSHNITTAGVPARGEFTIVVGPRSVEVVPVGSEASDSDIALRYSEVSEAGVAKSRKDVIARVGAELGLSRRQVFEAVERIKGLRQ